MYVYSRFLVKDYLIADQKASAIYVLSRRAYLLLEKS